MERERESERERGEEKKKRETEIETATDRQTERQTQTEFVIFFFLGFEQLFFIALRGLRILLSLLVLGQDLFRISQKKFPFVSKVDFFPTDRVAELTWSSPIK